MNLAQNIISNIITEKASIDWNNYLTPDEVDKFISKDDKVESAENIIYDREGNFYKNYFNDFKDEGWTKLELVQDLADFYHNGHLNEADKSFELWKSQIDKKEEFDLRSYLNRLLKDLQNYDSTELKSNKYDELLKKIDYVESRLGIKVDLGRILH